MRSPVFVCAALVRLRPSAPVTMEHPQPEGFADPPGEPVVVLVGVPALAPRVEAEAHDGDLAVGAAHEDRAAVARPRVVDGELVIDSSR